VHLNDTDSAQTTCFIMLLDDFGLHDLTGQPTHEHGQQLDIFAIHAGQPVGSTTVNPWLMSDHSLIIVAFNAASARALAQTEFAPRYRWRSFDYSGFFGELQQSSLVLDPPLYVSH